MFLEIQFPFDQALLISVVSIVTVFLILAIICGCVSLLKFIKVKKVDEPVVMFSKPLTMEDITDEDMMVAALIATIDYRQEVKTDVRLKSIREIK